MLRFVLLFFVWGAAQMAAAQCPKNTAQSLYDLKMAIAAGNITDPVKISKTAEHAANMCKTYGNVQGLAASVFVSAASLSKGAPAKLVAYSNGYAAMLVKARAPYIAGRPALTVQRANGRPVPLVRVYDRDAVLRDVAEGLAHLSLSGSKHAMYRDAYTSAMACPSDFLAQKEALILENWAKGDAAKTDVALYRLDGLYLICPKSKPELSETLARMHWQSAQFLGESKQWDMATKRAKHAQTFANRHFSQKIEAGMHGFAAHQKMQEAADLAAKHAWKEAAKAAKAASAHAGVLMITSQSKSAALLYKETIAKRDEYTAKASAAQR